MHVTYFRYALEVYISTCGAADKSSEWLTNDKIDLGPECESQVRMAHELLHLNRLNDAMFRNTLQ